MAKPIPYDEDDAPEDDERDMRKLVIYDDEALKLMQGWTGGQSDPLYAISSTGGWNYAWVFTDAISNIDRDLSRVKKLGRNKFQLGQGTFSGKEIDELRYIRDALQETLDNPESVMVDEARGGHVRAPRGASGGRWTVQAGRGLVYDGKPFAHLDKEGTDTAPVEADGAVILIAELFNQNGVTPDTIYAQHMGHARKRR
jgi:hypothetical protein